MALENLFDELARQDGVANIEGVLRDVYVLINGHEPGSITIFRLVEQPEYFAIGAILPLKNGSRVKVAYLSGEDNLQTSLPNDVLPAGLKYRTAVGLQQLNGPNGKPLFTYVLRL